MDKNIKTWTTLAFLPATLISGAELAGIPLTIQEKIAAVNFCIAMQAHINSDCTAEAILRILSPNIRRIEDRELWRVFSDSEIKKAIQAAQNGGIDNERCTD